MFNSRKFTARGDHTKIRSATCTYVNKQNTTSSASNTSAPAIGVALASETLFRLLNGLTEVDDYFYCNIYFDSASFRTTLEGFRNLGAD